MNNGVVACAWHMQVIDTFSYLKLSFVKAQKIMEMNR